MGANVTCGGDHQHAADLLTQGIVSSDLGHYTKQSALGEAMSALQTPVPPMAAISSSRSVRLSTTDSLSARILLSLSYPTHEMGQVSESIRLLVNAEQLASRRSLGQLSVVTRAQHGLLLLREGRAADAIKRLDGAVHLMTVAEPADQCKILINRGEAHDQLGHIQSAIEDFTSALDLSRRHSLVDLVAPPPDTTSAICTIWPAICPGHWN